MQSDIGRLGRIRVRALIQLGSALTLAATAHWGLADTATRDSSYGSAALWAQVTLSAALVAAVIAAIAVLMPPRLERRAAQVVVASLPPMLIAAASIMLGIAVAMGGVAPVFIGVVEVGN